MPYHPSKKILEKYADVMVNFALGKGKGIKKGDTVLVRSPEIAKPLYFEILKAIWKKGGNVIGRYSPDSERWFPIDKTFYEIASSKQLSFFPKKLMKAQIDSIDHNLAILAEVNPRSLQSIEPKKLMIAGEASKLYKEWFFEKENRGKLTWSLCLYGTDGNAKEARLTPKEYWNQIIKACFLDKKSPISHWERVFKQIKVYKDRLDKLSIEKLHIVGPDVDLRIKIGKDRIWRDGSGANIPSFEIFTSPDWRGTEGWIRFNQPLYRYGNLIEGIELWFKDGKVIKSKATKNEKVLKAMIATKNADKVGEFSLTDRRFSRITKFMAETLFDENVGGPNGNTHIALGSSYHECFRGNTNKLSKKEWENRGFNNSSVHTDIISTAPRIVTAYLAKNKTRVIYKNGQFIL